VKDAPSFLRKRETFEHIVALTIVADEDRAAEGGEAYAHSNAGRGRPGGTPPRGAVVWSFGGSITALAIAREAHGSASGRYRGSKSGHRAPVSLWRGPLSPKERGGYPQSGLRTRRPGRCLISTADLCFAFLRRKPGSPGKGLSLRPSPSTETLDICLSKAAFADWCLANRIEHPGIAGRGCLLPARHSLSVLVRPRNP